MSKAFESLINLHFGHLFMYHENQFGFSVGRGCNKVIFAFDNTVKYFRDRHSNVFLSELDVTKAFDRLNHFSVMKCLLERGFPNQVVNVFLIWFKNMRACIKWGCNKSVYFDIKSDCPEGNILGQKFFNRL